MFRWRETVSPHSRKDAKKGMLIPFILPHVLLTITQVWINQGDIVLLSLRDFQDDKADVIVKYTSDEARNR